MRKSSCSSSWRMRVSVPVLMVRPASPSSGKLGNRQRGLKIDMSGFVETLDSYRSGTLSRDELLAEIERQLLAGEADPGALLAALNNEQARERLPGNIHIEIVRLLLRRRDSPLD